MSSLWRAFSAVALLWMLAGCGGRDESGKILVFAAASLGDALVQVQEAYETRTGDSVDFSFGPSQMLAQQIASGAPADMLISAGQSPVRFLVERKAIEAAEAELLTNRLVVAVRSDRGLRLESVDELATSLVDRLAVADPDLAPAGSYARESLTQLGVWENVQPKLVFGADVRATLAYVESGNADAALVYLTDARAGRNVEALDIVPIESYNAIVYPVAIVERSENQEAALAFLRFLQSATSMDIFRRHGFEPAE